MKYYTRDGSRFVKTKPLKGMFLNNDGTFTEERTDKSIGICVHDDFEETIIASLSVSKNPVTYDVAESACKAAFPFGEGHIPSRKELFMAIEYKQRINADDCYLWCSDSNIHLNYLHVEGGGPNFYAWNLYWGDGDIDYDHKDTSIIYVIPFLTIKK